MQLFNNIHSGMANSDQTASGVLPSLHFTGTDPGFLNLVFKTAEGMGFDVFTQNFSWKWSFLKVKHILTSNT